jgi:two-component system sensor histidine kinase BaeS
VTSGGEGPEGPQDPWDPAPLRRERDREAALRARRWRTANRAWQGHGKWEGERPEWWPADEQWPPRGRRPPWVGRRGRFARGFGCLFALVFFVGLAGLVSLVTSVILASGPIGAIARVLGILILLGGASALAVAGRTFRRAARTLDELVEAAGRVEAGDYATRVAEPPPDRGALWELATGFNAMAARLESNEEQRRRLLADVSHELRTPLTVVQGNIEAILDGVHQADEAHLAAILDETRVLARLIDDLRTVALSESGRLQLHREPTDLSILAADAVAGFQPAAETAGVSLAVEVADDVPLLDVDPVRIREVLANLIANALRHTPPGGSISVDARPASDPAAVAIEVRDTGSGIDPSLLPHVFDRFAKSADSRGSGLGLAIARGLVEAHGGSIDVESAPNRGTTFRIRLPNGPSENG